MHQVSYHASHTPLHSTVCWLQGGPNNPISLLYVTCTSPNTHWLSNGFQVYDKMPRGSHRPYAALSDLERDPDMSSGWNLMNGQGVSTKTSPYLHSHRLAICLCKANGWVSLSLDESFQATLLTIAHKKKLFCTLQSRVSSIIHASFFTFQVGHYLSGVGVSGGNVILLQAKENWIRRGVFLSLIQGLSPDVWVGPSWPA